MSDPTEHSPVISFENPPPVKNPVLYVWRIIAKVLSFAIFGLGSVGLSIIALPVLIIFVHPRSRFRKVGHHLISLTFRFFVGVMSIIGSASIRVDDKKRFRSLKSCIVVANHPSLLDVVMLISQIPDADCIVSGYLAGKNILHFITNWLYIPNVYSHEELMERCIKSLESGSNLIIFPEGTRSLASGQNRYKKGAARVARASGCKILPVYIGGTDKRGLRKHDPMFMYNTRYRYIYDLHIKEIIDPADYSDVTDIIAAKRMTDNLRHQLSDEANRQFLKL